MIKTILFDFDETLTAGPKGGYFPFEELQEKFHLTEEQLTNGSERLNGSVKDYYMPQVSFHVNTVEKEKDLHREVFGLVTEDMHLKENKKDFIEHMIERRMKVEHELFPEVEDGLIHLKKQGYTLGVLTNALPSREKEIERTSIANLFDIALISNYVGLGKPDSKFYELAIKELNLKSNEIIFVDDKEKLIRPASELGMHVALMDRFNHFSECNFKRVSSVNELIQHINEISL